VLLTVLGGAGGSGVIVIVGLGVVVMVGETVCRVWPG
jgi:hypothetical protein